MSLMHARLDARLWNRLRPLFDEAAGLPLDEQQRYVASLAVHQPELAAQLEALLGGHRSTGAWLDRSVPERLLGSRAGPCADMAPEPLAGVRLNDRYRVERELGRGGLSIVYLARDEATLGRQVAVKVLNSPRNSDAIDNELAALATLHHPAIATPKDTGRTPAGQRFLVLEYIPGPSLREALEGAPLAPERAARLLRIDRAAYLYPLNLFFSLSK